MDTRDPKIRSMGCTFWAMQSLSRLKGPFQWCRQTTSFEKLGRRVAGEVGVTVRNVFARYESRSSVKNKKESFDYWNWRNLYFFLFHFFYIRSINAKFYTEMSLWTRNRLGFWDCRTKELGHWTPLNGVSSIPLKHRNSSFLCFKRDAIKKKSYIPK